MADQKISKKCLALLVIIFAGMQIFCSLPIISMICKVWQDTHDYDYSEAATWSGEGVTIENYGKWDYEKNCNTGYGRIVIDGVIYEATVELTSLTVDFYEKDESGEGLLIWGCSVGKSSKKKLTLVVETDDLCVRGGTFDHTGKTFILYKQ